MKRASRICSFVLAVRLRELRDRVSAMEFSLPVLNSSLSSSSCFTYDSVLCIGSTINPRDGRAVKIAGCQAMPGRNWVSRQAAEKHDYVSSALPLALKDRESSSFSD